MNPTPKGSRRQGAKAEAETQSPAPRSSSEVRAAIEKLAAETDQAKHQLAEHAKTWEATLLADDAVAEAHEAETARLRRAIARGELVQQQLATELSQVLAGEEVAEREAFRNKAAASVREVTSDAAVSQYIAAAEQIAGFLTKWNAATQAAEAARIPTPNTILRTRRGHIEQDRKILSPVTTDELGRTRDALSVVEVIPGERHPDVTLPELSNLVRLPGISGDGISFWPIAARKD